MQQNYGWSQSSGQNLPSNVQDNGAVNAKTQRPGENAGNFAGGLPYGQNPAFEAPASYQPQQWSSPMVLNDPVFNSGQNAVNAKAVPPQNSALGGQNAVYPNMGMKGQDYPSPAQTAPAENMQEYSQKPQGAAAAWSDDRVLQTRHSQTVGERGPVLEQDSVLHEALETFVDTKILERPVHVKGFGAFGVFQTTHCMREYTKLSFLQAPGQQVPVMVRFSLAAGNKGTPDTARNVRGFSAKFYMREGIFDLLCNHIPVLFVRDGIRFPEAFTSLAPSPVNNLIDPGRFWRFVARAPEATHFVTWLYSDLGTIKSLRHIRTYGVNTYVWRNAEGVRRYVKYHWIPVAGEECITRQEATTLAGINPDIAGKDLYETIAAGKPVQYELRVQLMDPCDENSLPYDPLDCTKVWDERRYPLLPVGVLTLNRNPENYMEQVEKAAFSPANLLAGAELSDDKLLQARANIYWDSQRRRLGQNFRSLPVNHQENWTPDEQLTSGAGTMAEGRLVRSELPKPDNFTQAGERYRSLSPEGQDHLVDNLAADLAAVAVETRNTVLGYFYNASPEMGQRVAARINAYTGRQ